MVIFYLFWILEAGIEGTALSNRLFIINKAKVAIEQPMYSENICLFFTSIDYAYFTTKAGMANPKPDPMILLPTSIDVAKFL